MSSTGAISVTPPKCNIPASGGKSKHTMLNMCDRKLAFKVRSSNNSNYSVSMTCGFLDVAESKTFEITRSNGKPKADKLVIQFADAQEGNSDAMSHFTEPIKGEVVGETVIKLSAAE